MEDNYGCLLVHAKNGENLPGEFTYNYHVHIIVRQGKMTFSDGKKQVHF